MINRVKMIPEIFKKASLLPTHEERIQYIRENQNELMRYIVQGALHPGVEWLLPTGEPPHIPGPTRDTEGILYKEFGRLYIFCKGGNPNLKQYQREKLFVDLLSLLHPEDARLLCAVKEKNIPYPYLNYEFFQEAFPDWLPAKEPEKILTINTDPNFLKDRTGPEDSQPTKKALSEEQKAKMAAGREAAAAKRQAEKDQKNF